MLFYPTITPQKSPQYGQNLASSENDVHILDLQKKYDQWLTNNSQFTRVKITNSTQILETNCIVKVEASSEIIIDLPNPKLVFIQPITISRIDTTTNIVKIRTTNSAIILDPFTGQNKTEITLTKSSAITLYPVGSSWYDVGSHNLGSQSSVVVKKTIARISTTYTPTNSSATKIQFNTTLYNVDSYFSTTDFTYRLGKNSYTIISGFLGLNATIYDMRNLYLYKNGSQYATLANLTANSIGGVARGTSFFLADYFLAGDVLDIRLAILGGTSNQILDTSTITFVSFEI